MFAVWRKCDVYFLTTMFISPAGSLEAKTAGFGGDFVSVLPKENERAQKF